MQSKIVQAVICHNCDDYGLQLMKTSNPQSQKIWILHAIKKTRIVHRTISDLWKVEACICTQHLVWVPFAAITASMRRGMEAISLWHCWGVMDRAGATTRQTRATCCLGGICASRLCFLLSCPRFAVSQAASQNLGCGDSSSLSQG